MILNISLRMGVDKKPVSLLLRYSNPRHLNWIPFMWTSSKKSPSVILQEGLLCSGGQAGGLSNFRVSVCGYIRVYLAIYGPEINGGFGLEGKSEKPKAVCGLARTNYGGLRNMRPPTIDPLIRGRIYRSYVPLGTTKKVEGEGGVQENFCFANFAILESAPS